MIMDCEAVNSKWSPNHHGQPSLWQQNSFSNHGVDFTKKVAIFQSFHPIFTAKVMNLAVF
jgi:hypothetical protein